MKKRRIRSWVKVAFLIITILIIIIIDYTITNDAIDKCVENGYDEQTCYAELG